MSDLPNLLINHIIFALGWTIVHSVWQFAIVTLCLMSARTLIKNTLVRYNIALLALIICTLTSVVTFYQYYSSIADIHIISTQTLLQTSSEMVKPTIDFVNTHLSFLVYIWLAGFCLHLFRTSIDFLHCRKLAVSECHTLDKAWHEKFNNLQRMLNIKGHISYRVSQLVNSPCVIGMLKPIVLIPSSMLMQMPAAQIEAVILHELAHIRRNDYLVNFIQCLAKSLFFFNPFFAYISKLVDQERENACDDIAVQACGSALVFSKSIGSLAELNSSNALTLAANSNKHQILIRIKRLFGDAPTKGNSSFQLISSAFIGLLGFLIAVNIQALPLGANTDISENSTQQIEFNAISIEPKESVRPLKPQAIQPPQAPASGQPPLPPEPPAMPKPKPAPITLTKETLIQKTAISYAALEQASTDSLIADNINQPSASANSTKTQASSNAITQPGNVVAAAKKSKYVSPLNRYLNTAPKIAPNSTDFLNWEKSRFSLFFLDKTVDFSKYDEIMLFPMTFDRMKISQSAGNREVNKWLDSSFEDMDLLCSYFDRYAKKAFKKSRQYNITHQGGENVLAIEFRMMNFTPFSAPTTTETSSGMVGNLIIQAVLVESQTGKLVAVIEHQIRIQDSPSFFTSRYVASGGTLNAANGGGSGVGIQYHRGVKGNPGRAWRKAFKLLTKNLYKDMRKLKKSHTTQYTLAKI